MWDIARELVELQELIDSFFNERQRKLPQDVWEYPPMNIEEYDDRFEVSLYVPGLNPKEDVEITYDKGYLHIKGEKKSDIPENVKVMRQERLFGTFQRSVKIETPVKADEVTASYTNGILRIILPKAEESKVRKIEIS